MFHHVLVCEGWNLLAYKGTDWVHTCPPPTVRRKGSEEIRQAEGIKIELKTGFVFLFCFFLVPSWARAPANYQALWSLLNVFEIHWMQIIELEMCYMTKSHWRTATKKKKKQKKKKESPFHFPPVFSVMHTIKLPQMNHSTVLVFVVCWDWSLGDVWATYCDKL